MSLPPSRSRGAKKQAIVHCFLLACLAKSEGGREIIGFIQPGNDELVKDVRSSVMSRSDACQRCQCKLCDANPPLHSQILGFDGRILEGSLHVGMAPMHGPKIHYLVISALDSSLRTLILIPDCRRPCRSMWRSAGPTQCLLQLSGCCHILGAWLQACNSFMTDARTAAHSCSGSFQQQASPCEYSRHSSGRVTGQSRDGRPQD